MFISPIVLEPLIIPPLAKDPIIDKAATTAATPAAIAAKLYGNGNLAPLDAALLNALACSVAATCRLLLASC